MKVNKIYLNLLTVGMLSFMTGCAGDENIDRTEGKETDNSSELTAFSSVSSNRLMKYAPRTSMGGHQYLTGSDFYWEPGDQIYVKDDNNVLQKSTMTNISATQPTARFQVPGAYTAQNSYEVYYTGAAAGATSNKVSISTAQLQTAPNNAKHIGVSGDCGTATATRMGDHFEFMLDHKATYLCFLPRVTNAALGKNVFLTKIVVKSDNAIAGDYTLSMSGLSSAPTANAATEITLTTQGTTLPNGFPLSNTVTSVATNAAYMVIAPGTHTLTVDYYMKDPVTNIEGAVTKILSAKNFEANKVYDITADLTVRNYDGSRYYMWDAKKQYWEGHEWNKGGNQPILSTQLAGSYAQNNTDPRWYNESATANGIKNDATTPLFQTYPNINEMVWYASKGDPRWDGVQLWSLMSHLYKGGIWLKKKDYISGFNANTAPDGTDWRIGVTTSGQWHTSNTLPSSADASKYFYLPALGHYSYGLLYYVSSIGRYWTSSANPGSSGFAYHLYFDHLNNISCSGNYRYNGYWSQPFE